MRRADGQAIQLTPLLYLVLEAIDGKRQYDEIAAMVSGASGRGVTADDVRQLVEAKLRPLGVLRLPDGTDPEVRKSNPLLGLRFRWVVSDPEMSRRITAPFTLLFRPLVVLAVVAAFAVTCGWVLFEKGLASATHQAFDQPGLLLVVFLITIVSAGFHEFGHAAACRYGGATPGVMGAGLYLVWPAFYTDVTDSYRLGRGARLRVDLGGLYFNGVVAVAMFAAWALTRWDAILLIIATQVLQMFRQLAPFLRFDGYHILADVTGVPDLYAHIKPTLLGLLPGRWRSNEGSALKPWARAIVSAWVLIVVPVLLAVLGLIVLALPRVLGTAWAAVGRHWQLFGHHLGDGDAAAAGVRLLSIVAIALPMLGMVYLLVRLVRQVTTSTWRATEGHRWRRVAAVATAAAVLVALALAWWPDESRYRPIQPYERGTVLDVLPLGSHRPLLQEGQVSAADTVWAANTKPPTREQPALALVLIPRTGTGAPWVFPFDRPPGPGQGDNQALAVNTGDGSTVYDVAFALVWADDGAALNRNEAYAFASCRKCRTVAVSFQVVMVVGQADVVVPQNISGAVNYSCDRCLTYALAKQLVISLPNGLSPTAKARLAALWRKIEKFAATIHRLPPERIHAQLKKYEAAVRAIVKAEAAAAAADTDVTQAEPAPTSTPPQSSGAASSTPSVSPQAEARPSSDTGATSSAEPSADGTGSSSATATATATATGP